MTEKQFFPASIIDELAYCAEKADKHPLIQTWIYTLEGEISTRALQEALDDTLNYYPKFKCTLVNTYPSLKRWFRYRWEYRDVKGRDILQEIESPDSVYDHKEIVNYYIDNHYRLFIDISSHIPLKVLLIRQPHQSFLIFVFHHAAADGLGSSFFIQKFIHFYEAIFYQREKEAYSSDFKAISQPEIRLRWNQFSLPHILHHFKYMAMLRKEPAAQIYTQRGEVTSGTFLTDVREIPPHQFKSLKTAAKKNQVTINSYILAAMFQTIKKWNQQHGEEPKCIRIAVPISLRPPEDCTAGNIMAGVNISFKPELIGNKVETLKRVHKEIVLLMKGAIERPRVNLAYLLKPIPLALTVRMIKRLAPNSSPSSFVLSNLAILSPNPSHKDEAGFHYLGSARICGISAIPPAGQCPGIAINTYNQQMTLSLSVLSSHFSLETAGRFMDTFVHELIEKSI